MSLDITFYGKEFYKKLLESGFPEIGASHKIKIKIDDEETEIDVVDLEKGKITNRDI